MSRYSGIKYQEVNYHKIRLVCKPVWRADSCGVRIS